ncbi:MAG: ABC transporter ATP-binding protein [Oscillospiraceae bacterium]|jgi:putative ABC transport system ATP-binding protein
MEQLIQMKAVSKWYRRGENVVKALDGVDFSVRKGEFVAIIGASGSGKSTLMNLIGCLDVPTRGSYALDGCDVMSLREKELSEIRNKKIGFVFQGFYLIPGLNATENVELPLLYRGMPRAERRELSAAALERVGLGNRMTHLPGQMSGGQQQRVAIARAIAARPPVLLADEPTGNLDSKSGAEIMAILQELHEEGKTILLITHDQKVAGYAERVFTMRDGHLSPC